MLLTNIIIRGIQTVSLTISDHMGATVRMKRDFLLKQAFFLFLSGLKS